MIMYYNYHDLHSYYVETTLDFFYLALFHTFVSRDFFFNNIKSYMILKSTGKRLNVFVVFAIETHFTNKLD